MLGHRPVIRLAGVKVLNQMIPRRPFPDNFAACRPGNSGFHNMRREQAFRVAEFRVGAGGDDLLVGLKLPGQQQHIPVGHFKEVMMRPALSTVPKDVPIPVNFPHTWVAALALPGESQQISILQQPCEQALSIQLPLVNYPSLIVNQVNRLASDFIK